MARLKELAVGRGGDSFIFDPEMIEERPGYNVREMNSPETQSHIRKMADAIHAGGTSAFPPITICQEDGKIYVIAGYCRRRAFILAKNEGAPVKGILAIANTQKEDERTLDLLNSNDGLPLTPLEKAQAVKRLLSFQWTPAEIARRRGCSVTAISDLVRLLEAPEEIRDMVKAGEVSARLAVDVVRGAASSVATAFATLGDAGAAASVAVETLRTAVETAKAEGKTKATPKHLPKPSDSTDWKKYGPRMKKALEAFRDADSQEEIQQCIESAAKLLSEMA